MRTSKTPNTDTFYAVLTVILMKYASYVRVFCVQEMNFFRDVTSLLKLTKLKGGENKGQKKLGIWTLFTQ